MVNMVQFAELLVHSFSSDSPSEEGLVAKKELPDEEKAILQVLQLAISIVLLNLIFFPNFTVITFLLKGIILMLHIHEEHLVVLLQIFSFLLDL